MSHNLQNIFFLKMMNKDSKNVDRYKEGKTPIIVQEVLMKLVNYILEKLGSLFPVH